MTSGPTKSLYYYIVFGLACIGLGPMLIAVMNFKGLILNNTLFDNITHTVNTLLLIIIEFYFISEIYKNKEGYTTVTTTKYNLYKCRESGEEESFMMFADSEEELEQFFQITMPGKQVFIEPASMTGKSINMKIFNQIQQ